RLIYLYVRYCTAISVSKGGTGRSRMSDMSSQKELKSSAWGEEIDAAAIEAAAREARARELARLVGLLAGKVKSAFNAAVVAPMARWRRREALAQELYSLDE